MKKKTIDQKQEEYLIEYFMENQNQLELFASVITDDSLLKLINKAHFYVRQILNNISEPENETYLSEIRDFIYDTLGINILNQQLKKSKKRNFNQPGKIILNFYMTYHKSSKSTIKKIYNFDKSQIDITHICRSIMSPFSKKLNISLFNKLDSALSENEDYCFFKKPFIYKYLETTALRWYFDQIATWSEIQKSELSTLFSLNKDKLNKIILANQDKTDYFLLNVSEHNLDFAKEVINDNDELLIKGDKPCIERIIHYYSVLGSPKSLFNADLLAYIFYKTPADDQCKAIWFKELNKALQETQVNFSKNFPKENHDRYLNLIQKTSSIYEKIIIDQLIDNNSKNESEINKKKRL